MNPINFRKNKKKKEKYPDRRSVTDLVNELTEMEAYRKKFIVSEEAVIEALKIEPEDRKIEQIGIITKFLEGSELANKFKSENVNPNFLKDILTLCACHMKYHFMLKDEILFRIGDKPDNFYIIILGKIGILKPVSIAKEITGIQYFQEIYELKKNNENFLLNLTLVKNKDVFKITPIEIEKVQIMILNKFIEDYFGIGVGESDYYSIEQILNACKLDKNYFEIEVDPRKRSDKIYMSLVKDIIFKKLPKYDKKMDKFRMLGTNRLKFPITLFKYKSFLQLKNNDFFGDSAMDKKTVRNATIKTIDETHFCFLDNEHYNNFLKEEKNKISQREVKFLIANYFFNTVIESKFEKNYLNWFIYEEKQKDEFIIKENNPVDYLYFIKEGIVELSINKNVFEIENIIQYLTKLCKNNNNNFNSFNVRNTHYENNIYDLKKHLQKNKKIKLLLIHDKDCIGIESLYFGINFLYTAQIISETCKIYKIDINNIFKIFNDEIEVFPTYIEECYKRIEILLERLISLNDNRIEMIDHNVTQQQKNYDENNKEFIVDYKKKTVKQKYEINIKNKKFCIKNGKRKSSLFLSQDFLKGNNFYLTSLENNNKIKSRNSYKNIYNLNNEENKNTINSIETFSNNKTEDEIKYFKREGSKTENNLLKKLRIEFKKEKNDKLFVTFSPNKNINNNNLVPFLIEENVLFNNLNLNNNDLLSSRSLNSFRNTNSILKNSLLKEKIKKYEIFNKNNKKIEKENIIKKIYFSGKLPNLNNCKNKKINTFRQSKLSGLYQMIRNEKYKKFKEKMHQKNIWDNNNNNDN